MIANEKHLIASHCDNRTTERGGKKRQQEEEREKKRVGRKRGDRMKRDRGKGGIVREMAKHI